MGMPMSILESTPQKVPSQSSAQINVSNCTALCNKRY